MSTTAQAPVRPNLSRSLRTILVVAGREMYEHSRNRLVWALVGFTVVLAGFATQVGLAELRARGAAHAQLSVQRDQDRMRGAGQVTGWQLEPALRVLRAPEPLSVVVAGADVSMPQYWDFGPAGVRTGQLHSAEQTSDPIDIEYIVRVALGLLAIILAVESVAGERASGVLLALLSQPLRPGAVLAGKLIGGGVTLALASALVILTVLAVIASGARPLLTGSFVASSVMVGAASWLYLFTFFIFGVLVSVAVQSYRAAFAATIVVWVVSGAAGGAVPRVIARGLAPVPPASVLEAQNERVLQERIRRVQLEMGDRYLEGMAPADWTRVDRDPAARAAAVARIQPVWDRHVAALHAEIDRLAGARTDRVMRQRRIARTLAWISPGAQFAAAATNLAGTGDAAASRWHAAAGAYQRQLNGVLFGNPARLTLFVPGEPRRGPAQDGRWVVALMRRSSPALTDLPAFSAPQVRWTARLRDAAAALAVMAATAAGLILAAAAAFKRIRF
jgi:ABC-type transport system involved in multi-copper enzyme maturation permease subunit